MDASPPDPALYDRSAGSAGVAAMIESLRRTICLGDPTEAMLLHETRLATQFGVSRTPVRQALQRLAYERLVETRSGVGTGVVPLAPADAGAHVALLRGVLTLAIGLGPRPVPARTAGELPAEAATPLEAVFEERAAILRAAQALIPDPILQESHAAAHWRVLRWRLAAARTAPEAALGAAAALRRTMLDQSDAAAMLRLLAEEPDPVIPSGG